MTIIIQIGDNTNFVFRSRVLITIFECYNNINNIGKNTLLLQFYEVTSNIDGKLKFNPVYLSSIKKLDPFIANEETSGNMLWDLEGKIENIDEVDYRLLDYSNRSPGFRIKGE